jgi:hypothetical protein
MTESICGLFLTAFLVFYSTVSVVLLYGVIQGVLRSRLKRPRVVKMPVDSKKLGFVPPRPQRNTKSQWVPG